MTLNWQNVVVGLCFVLLLLFGIPIHINRPISELEDQFVDFMQEFNKTYDNDTIYQQRFKAFKHSVNRINKLNAQRNHSSSATYGLTEYSDMTPNEFLENYLQSDLHERISSRNSKESEEHGRNKRTTTNFPPAVDWRQKGVVTKVNNQKLCGACWAFSVAENMETMYAIKNGKLIQLSVQQLLDCAGYDNDGCKGGDTCSLLQWLKDFDIGVETEDQYPLHLVTETCKAPNNSTGVRIDKFACDSLADKEDIILATIAQVGPVAVAINALTWQNYLGGVIQFHCSGIPTLLNHAVQIVGYNLTADIPYYIVRNTWGEDFGDKGYLYIAIGNNVCGLANEVSVLTIL